MVLVSWCLLCLSIYFPQIMYKSIRGEFSVSVCQTLQILRAALLIMRILSCEDFIGEGNMELNKYAQDKTLTWDSSDMSDFVSYLKCSLRSQWIIAEEYGAYSLSLLSTFSRLRMHV